MSNTEKFDPDHNPRLENTLASPPPEMPATSRVKPRKPVEPKPTPTQIAYDPDNYRHTFDGGPGL